MLVSRNWCMLFVVLVVMGGTEMLLSKAVSSPLIPGPSIVGSDGNLMNSGRRLAADGS